MTRLELDLWGPVDTLAAVIHHRTPQVVKTIIPEEGTGQTHLRVRFRRGAPRMVRWTGTTYEWQRAGQPWEALSASAQDAADQIAVELGVPKPRPGAGAVPPVT